MFVRRLRTLCRLPGCRRLLLFWLRQAPEEVPLKDYAWRSKARRPHQGKNQPARAHAQARPSVIASAAAHRRQARRHSISPTLRAT